MTNFRIKNTLFGYFIIYNFKKLLSYLKSAPWNLCISKILRKIKNLLISDQKCLIRHLWPRILCLAIFGLELKKTTAIYEMSTLKVVKFEKFAKKQQYLNFGTKMPYGHFFTGSTSFGFFWANNLRLLLSYLISAAWNLPISKILPKKEKS